eukprot:gene23458-28457_t
MGGILKSKIDPQKIQNGMLLLAFSLSAFGTRAELQLLTMSEFIDQPGDLVADNVADDRSAASSTEDKPAVQEWEEELNIPVVKVEEEEVTNATEPTTQDDTPRDNPVNDVSSRELVKDTPLKTNGDENDDEEPKKESIQDLRQWIRKTSIRVKSFTGKPGDFGDSSPAASPANKAATVTSPTTTTRSTILPAHNLRPTNTPYSPSRAAGSGAETYAASIKPVSSVAPAKTASMADPNASIQTSGPLPASAFSLPYEELVRRNTEKNYEGLVQTQLETHLTDADFLRVFGKNRTDFYQQAKWKQVDQKKKARIF